MNTINVTQRDLTVKAKKLRRNGYVPGSVFGGMLKEPVALQIEESVARQLVRELREGSRLKLNLDGTVIPVQIKEKSLDNLKHEILEISFQALAADQAVNSVIDIVLVNADKVTAVLEKLNMKIPYSALPADMIDTLEIDVDGMPVGTIVTVGDIPELKSEKLALQVNSDEIVFRITDGKRGGGAASEAEEAPAAE